MPMVIIDYYKLKKIRIHFFVYADLLVISISSISLPCIYSIKQGRSP